MALNFTTNRGWTAGKITPDVKLTTAVTADPISDPGQSFIPTSGRTPEWGPQSGGTPAPGNSPAFLQDAINQLLQAQKTGGTGGVESLLRKILGGAQQQQQPGFDPQIGQGYNAYQQAQAGYLNQQTEGLRAFQQMQDKLIWNPGGGGSDYFAGQLTEEGRQKQRMESLVRHGKGAYGSMPSAPMPGFASAPLPGWR